MKNKLKYIALLILAILSTPLINAQNSASTISEEDQGTNRRAPVLRDYTRMGVLKITDGSLAEGRKIETYGTVDIVEAPEAGIQTNFILKGDEGGRIKVYSNLNHAPIPSTRKDPLFVTVHYRTNSMGILEPYLQEAMDQVTNESKSVPNMTNQQLVASANIVPVIQHTEKIIPDQEIYQTTKYNIFKQIIPYSLPAFLILLIAGIIVYLVISKSNVSKSANLESGSFNVSTPAPSYSANVTRSNLAHANMEDEITIRQSDVTVRVQEESTREFFPLHLVIKSGHGNGTQIPLCSSVGGGRNIIIGRRKKDSPSGASFIGLEDNTQALSGQQVKLTYDKTNSRVLLENQGGVNPTQIDGRSMGSAETITLKPGMSIGLPPNYLLEVKDGAYFPNRS